jgi:predicted metalloprotease with PDZ domain
MSLRNPPLIAAALFVFAFAASVGRARAQEAPIALTVDASEAPVTSIVHVHETIPVTPDAPLDLAYPRWVPGEHGPSGPLANVAFLRASYLGKTFEVTRDLADLNEFHVAIPADVSSVDIDFDYLGSKDGTYGESRLATATILAVNWNQFLVYPQKADITTLRFAPTLVLPGPAWTAETALPGPVRTGDRISFATATLERLVDSPLDAGTAFRRFMLLDAGGFTNEIDAFADRPEQLALPDKQLAGFKAVVGEMDAIYGARHWKNYHFLLTISDAMPGNGVEHGSSSDDGNDGNGLTDPAGIIGTAGLLSHEFNHSWDGKYRRPADLATNNFQVPEQTDLLWIYEGMTQFYGDLVPTRAGLWTPEYYRDTLALGYAREDQEPGRSVRPLADTAAAAPVLYPAARSLSGERRTAGDFYTEGELLWLDVAAKIDADSHGKKSLDGFCRRFFGIADTPSQVNPYTYAQFVAALSDYAPGDWNAYFQSRVYGLAAHPPDGFEKLGWRLVYTDVPNLPLARYAKQRHTSPVASGLGITVDDKGLVSDVLTDSPAARGGLGYGDTIVAVDNREFDVDSYAEAVKATKDSTAPLVMIVKRNGLFRTLSIVYRGGLRFPHLERIAGTPDRLSILTAPHRS